MYAVNTAGTEYNEVTIRAAPADEQPQRSQPTMRCPAYALNQYSTGIGAVTDIY